MTAAYADNSLGMKLYNSTTMNQLFSFNFNEKIIVSWGFPVDFFSSFIPNQVVICNETVKIVYNGVVHNALTFSQTYQPGVICDSAIFLWWYQNDWLDNY